MIKLPAALAVAAVSAAVLAPAASAGDDLGPYERFEFSYTSKRPGTATGFRYRVKLEQSGADQPPVVRELRLVFARGTKIETGAVVACSASQEGLSPQGALAPRPGSQEELTQQGPAACPAGARVARGEADVYVGSATPLTLTATV